MLIFVKKSIRVATVVSWSNELEVTISVPSQSLFTQEDVIQIEK